MTDSIIRHSPGGTSYEGKDAIAWYKANSLRVALELYGTRGMQVTRGLPPTKMLTLASQYSGKAYKRGQYLQAAADVKLWADTMYAALPKEIQDWADPSRAPIQV